MWGHVNRITNKIVLIVKRCGIHKGLNVIMRT